MMAMASEESILQSLGQLGKLSHHATEPVLVDRVV